MTDRLPIPGPRDVTASLDTPDAARVVVACPPHPQMGGDRNDSRLRAVSDALAEADCACLRFDYGPWDEGRAEVTDARSALAWAHGEYASVGLFGYSFGGSMALLAAAAEFREETDTVPAAVSVLAPASTVHGRDVVPAVDDIACPLDVHYGERDDTVDSLPVAERARERGRAVTPHPSDHFFAGQRRQIASDVASFFGSSL